MVTRRDLLKVGTAVAVTASLGASQTRARAQGVTTLRTRKDVKTLTDDSPDIKALRAAITKMKNASLPANDGRRWEAQAHIHGNAQQFTHCQHANYFFFPWHRAYLHYFEDIVRNLSGYDQFALPYWDWTHNGQLPSQFWGAGNPLFDPNRRPGLTSSSTISPDDVDTFVGQTVISELLGIDDFETFAGAAVTHPGDHAGEGQLEGGPHNFVHRWVFGDMVTGQSPLDPIFWLHHCNIDRLWSEWALRHPSRAPIDPSWHNQPFQDFVDGSGEPVTVAVSEVLDTAALGYQYDTRRIPIKVTSALTKQKILTWSGTEAFVRQTALIGNMVVATSPVQREAISTSMLQSARGKPSTIRLRIRDVPIIGSGDYAVQVFVNCKKLSAETLVSDPSYVASFTFFGAHEHLSEPQRISVLLNVTPVFARLYGDRKFGADEPLVVGLRLRPLFPGGPTAIPVTITQITPAQVSVDVIT